MRTIAWSADSRAIIYFQNQRGFVSLRRCDVATGKCELMPGLDAYTELQQLALAPRSGAAAMIASSTLIQPRVVSIDSNQDARIHRRSGAENLSASQLSAAEAIAWRGDDGGEVHGLFYPPVLQDDMPAGAPPLVVNVHGGPTSQRYAGFAFETQFFTTRGYAVLQVNHRGSTGYGKAYMDMHRGNWGVYDVTDVHRRREASGKGRAG